MNDRDEFEWRKCTDKEKEWYRLWFDFLKLSDKEYWSDNVKRDFGIDYFNDVSCTFEGWWDDHEHLFRKLKLKPIDVITSEEHFRIYKEEDAALSEYPDVLPLFVHMWAKREELIAAFNEVLNKYHKGKPGRPLFDDVGDVYDFHQRPNTVELERTLAVYRVWKKSVDEGMFKWKIEEEASKELPIIKKNYDFKGSIWHPRFDTDRDIIDERKRRQCTAVIKYLKYAKNILENVAEGRFPDKTKRSSKK